MTTPNTIKIVDTEYVKRDKDTEGDIKIVMLQHNFVYIGRIGQIHVAQEWLVITNASNIRSWGTTKGIGELVNGPTLNTVCDYVGTVRVPIGMLVSLIDVVQDKWK